jgi:hypothetical protein
LRSGKITAEDLILYHPGPCWPVKQLKTKQLSDFIQLM